MHTPAVYRSLKLLENACKLRMLIKECLELRKLVAKLVEWKPVVLGFEVLKPLGSQLIYHLVIDAVHTTKFLQRRLDVEIPDSSYGADVVTPIMLGEKVLYALLRIGLEVRIVNNDSCQMNRFILILDNFLNVIEDNHIPSSFFTFSKTNSYPKSSSSFSQTYTILI